MRLILHHVTCPIRTRYRRWRWHQPFWRDDKTAQMLGIAGIGCRRCGLAGGITPNTDLGPNFGRTYRQRTEENA